MFVPLWFIILFVFFLQLVNDYFHISLNFNVIFSSDKTSHTLNEALQKFHELQPISLIRTRLACCSLHSITKTSD